MEDGEREAQAIATFTNLVTPATIEAVLADVTDVEVLKRHFDNAAPLVVAGLAIRCAALARAKQLAAGHGKKATEQAGRALGIKSERTAARYIQWWEEIFKPTIDRDGDAAVFLLEDGLWYASAIEAAPAKEMTPVQLIDDATRLKTANPALSARRWRREHLGLSNSGDSDDGSTTSDGKKLWGLLKKLAKWDDDLIRDAVKGADAQKVLDDARDALVAARTALDLLEERVKGRTEP